MPYHATSTTQTLSAAVRRGLFLSLLAVAPVLPGLAQADTASQTEARQYNIAAGSLDQVLNRFASAAGILLSVDAQMTEGKRSDGLQGRYEVAQGLQRVLAGSGLQAVQAGNGWMLQPQAADGPLQLGATQVSAAQVEESAWGPVAGIVAKRSATGSKTDSALVEIPQTINVVTASEIKARGAMSVTEALRYTPGMTGGGFADRVKVFDEPTSRGFSPTPLYLDGLHLPYGGGSTGGALQIDPYTLERIEVLKGPASVLYGQNQPGGIVNMVSKRPTETPLHQVVLEAGTYDHKSVSLDLGGPLDEQGQFLYRLTGRVTDSQSEVNYAEQKRQLIAPSLTWRPNDDTSLTLFGQYQKDNDVPEAQGLPRIGTLVSTVNGKIDRDLFLGEPGVNAYDRDQFVLGYELSHRLDETWTLKQNARYADVDDHFRAPLHGYSFVANPVTGANDQRYMTRYGVDWKQHNRVLGVDNIAQAEFDTGALKHTLLVGLDYYRFNSQFAGKYDRTPPIIDLYTPTYGQSLDFTGLYRWDNTVNQTGLYVQDQIKLDRWVLVLGGRYDWAKTDNEVVLAKTRSGGKDEAFSGRAGLVYLFDNGLAPFVSYSESFLPLSGTDADFKAFEPSTGRQYEVGIKYQPPGQESFVQISAYHLDQENVLNSIPGTMFSDQSGAVRSVGLELEGKAALSEALEVIGSLSRNDIKYTKDDSGRQGRHPAGSPPLTAALWVNYTLLGDTPMAGLGAGLGARYVRSSYGTDYAGAFQIPSYTVLDAAVTYDLSKSPLQLKGVKLALNVKNLEDKTYVDLCRSDVDCYYGEGRTVLSSLTYDW
ncbi:TonB-dependent siderophore receptor [Pseudomonas sp. MAFF 302030]|uniref:Metal-pseudopaline receptor CntO n=1 Tax=Pseudomonas morbosilactucae TaxID=2938197 RepID=A0A9X1YS56_9PSED|nr:TonB-dependent siderophore receptor [Pseudomonas morbosilactucae]MCK9797014.1 TonB-dependent siderophore receptor [Pseudomonas morbosilactucae]